LGIVYQVDHRIEVRQDTDSDERLTLFQLTFAPDANTIQPLNPSALCMGWSAGAGHGFPRLRSTRTTQYQMTAPNQKENCAKHHRAEPEAHFHKRFIVPEVER
jgi:hypothetical protein